MRLNSFIGALERQEVAFGHLLPVGDDHMARRIGESDLDFVVLDFEHEGFDFPALGTTLQWLVSRRRMLHDRSVLATPTPLVRVPTDASETARWIVKQTLDYGPFGIVVPHLQTAAQAAELVAMMRYPVPAGADRSGPQGQRGFWPGLAWRYWGCNAFADYFERADLWPLAPGGELLLMVIVEEVAGWENIEEIVRVPGIGAVWFGPGDGSVSIGNIERDFGHPRLTEYRDHVLAVCREAGIVAGSSAKSPAQIEALIERGARFVITSGTEPERFAATGRGLAGRVTSTWAERRLRDVDGCSDEDALDGGSAQR